MFEQPKWLKAAETQEGLTFKPFLPIDTSRRGGVLNADTIRNDAGQQKAAFSKILKSSETSVQPVEKTS